MKTMIMISLIAGTLLATGAWAETAQQSRMTTCNADAGKQSLAGEARKAFMKSCLSGGEQPAARATTQQQRMKDCNAEAKAGQMKGEARKTFMKSCLSGK